MNDITKKRWIILYYSFSIYVGMSGAVFGPALLKLVEQTNSTIGNISLIFPTRAISYLAGSWIAGLLFDKFKGHKLLVRILPFIAITLVLVPFMKTPLGLILVSMIMALATGMVDVGCNSLLFRVPDIKIAPAMSGLHFFFGLGAFIAPLTLAGSLKITEGIQWGFWGLGLVSILILIQFINLQGPALKKFSQPKGQQTKKATLVNRTQIIWVIAIFFFAFVGVEVGYGDWLSVYSIKSGLATEQAAILLTSTYWGAFTFSRLISIPLATRIKQKKILLVNIVGAVLGLGLVFLIPHQSKILLLGTIILGFSVAPLFATMLTFAESLMPMTGRVTSIFFISGSMGSIFVPWLIGRSVEDLGPRYIIQVLYMTLLLAAVVLVVIMQVSKKKPQYSLRFLSID